MATPKQVTEPATPAVVAQVTEPERVYDPHKKVRVYDTETGEVLRRPVPETWLDGRFPRLQETRSSKAGK